ncbi:unnamed protein product [Ceutorhynchus assimilis]|uniref:RING-type domain-containing protein n=1 Tax=Ceutorhynchus assimilis TaxID=467358 RepID=A0A9N9QQ66_9CUCU|nr:unnamed protein product [Ceutorhynchus assimilis]
MDYLLDLVLQYPLIKLKAIEKSDKVLIRGKMLVKNKDIFIALKQTAIINGRSKYKLIKLDEDFNESTAIQIKQILEKESFQNVLEVLNKIHKHLETEKPLINLENHCEIYRKVIHEYSEFTKFFLHLKTSKLLQDLSAITASITDSNYREHSVKITVDFTQKTSDIFEISEFDLPQRIQDTFKPNENLIVLFDQFLARIERLQPYFDLMEEFDRNTTVLDPEKPKRSDSHRRIWLGENISTIITIDPYNVFQRPNFKFLGPEYLVESYSNHLNNNLGNWVCQENIFQGILDLLGLEDFPKRPTTKNQHNLLVDYGECSICFSLRLNEKLPEVICTNKRCEKFYHNECLYGWFVASNAKIVFNAISGNCPNCEKTISCPVLE